MGRRRGAWVVVLGLAVGCLLSTGTLVQAAPEVPPPTLTASAAVSNAHEPGTSATERLAAAAGNGPAVAEPAAPGSPSWFLVRVVDAQDAPVPGAEVFALAESRRLRLDSGLPGMPEHEVQLLSTFAAEMVRRFGVPSLADGAGSARVAVEGSTAVWAFGRGGAGLLTIVEHDDVPAGGYCVRLAPDPSLVVQVLDHHGVPASGVPLAILRDDGACTGFEPWGHYPLAVSSGPAGQAVLPHVALWTSVSSWCREVQPGAKRRVMAFLPGVVDRGEPVDLVAPADRALVLRLPPTGKLRVKVELGDRGWPGGPPRAYLWTEDWWQAQFCRAIGRLGDDGWTQFDHVPVGVPMKVYADGPVFVEAKVTVARPDEVVDLVLRPTRPVAWGELVDAAGVPLADTEGCCWSRSVRPWPSQSFTTDAAGRFVIGWPGDDESGYPSLVLELSRPGGPPLGALLAGGAPRSPITGLGRVVAEPWPLLVAGRVVAGGIGWSEPVRLVAEGWNDSEPPSWVALAETRVVRGADGAFAVHWLGWQPARVRLRLHDERLLPVAPIEFVPGQTGLVVAVRPAERLAVSVRMPPGAPSGWFAELEPDRPSGPVAVRPAPVRCNPWPTEGSAAQWQLAWQGLSPGTYTLRIGHEALPVPLAELRGVEVPPPAADDRQLWPLDLREQIRLVQVEINSSQVPAPGALRGQVLVEPSVSRAGWSTFEIVDGVGALLVPSLPVQVRVGAPGHHPVTLVATTDRVAVTLSPRVSTSFLAVGLGELPPPVKARFRLRAIREGARLPGATTYGNFELMYFETSSYPEFDVGAGAAVELGDLEYEVELVLKQEFHEVVVRGTLPARVQGPGGSVVLTIPAGAVGAALTELATARAEFAAVEAALGR